MKLHGSPSLLHHQGDVDERITQYNANFGVINKTNISPRQQHLPTYISKMVIRNMKITHIIGKQSLVPLGIIKKRTYTRQEFHCTPHTKSSRRPPSITPSSTSRRSLQKHLSAGCRYFQAKAALSHPLYDHSTPLRRPASLDISGEPRSPSRIHHCRFDLLLLLVMLLLSPLSMP